MTTDERIALALERLVSRIDDLDDRHLSEPCFCAHKRSIHIPACSEQGCDCPGFTTAEMAQARLMKAYVQQFVDFKMLIHDIARSGPAQEPSPIVRLH